MGPEPRLVFHLSAMVVAPASVGPLLDLLGSAWDFFQPYLQFPLPQPRPPLLRPRARREHAPGLRGPSRGRHGHRAGRIPNFKIRPRLLYHRHFMLTEHMNQAPDELREAWYRSYALHIGRKYGASKVSLLEDLTLPADHGDGPERQSNSTTRPATKNNPWGSSDATRH